MNAADEKKDENARALFRTGIYRHFKGGWYSAYGLTRHHASGRSYVMYASMETGSLRIRPLVRLESHAEEASCWMDEVQSAVMKTPRFSYLGPLP